MLKSRVLSFVFLVLMWMLLYYKRNCSQLYAALFLIRDPSLIKKECLCILFDSDALMLLHILSWCNWHNVQTHQFSGWRSCQTSVHLSPPDTSASHCEYCEHKMGERGRGRSELKIWYDCPVPLQLRSIIPAKIWDSPSHLSPGGQTAGIEGQHMGGCGGDLERYMLPWEQVIIKNESWEHKSISTPSTGPLTPHQHPTNTRGEWPGFT